MKDAIGDGAPLSYILALESSAGWTAESRLAVSAQSAFRGHAPFHRYFLAGKNASVRGAGLDAIERETREWLRATFHPLHAFLLGVDDPFVVVEANNVWNDRDIGMEWKDQETLSMMRRETDEFSARASERPRHWRFSSDTRKFRLRAFRSPPDGFDAPQACQAVSLASVQFLAEQAGFVKGHASARTLTSVAAELGAERSLLSEAAWIFEQEGSMSIDALAKRLGCGKRTVERGMQAAGLTAGQLRLSTMIIGAVNQLHSDASLTTIAADNGFADLAHMGRAIKASCGLSPSVIRAAAQRLKKSIS